MTFRGYPTHLIDRVQRANSHYLDTATLRWFDSYGGRHSDTSAQEVYVVESCSNEWDGRRWRVVMFEFSPGGQTVETTQYDWHATRHAADRHFEEVTQ